MRPDRKSDKTAEDRTFMDRCIVIGAGELTVPGIEVKDGDFVIAADAGFSHCERLGIEPDLIVGDFDSLKEGDGEALEEIRRREPERILTLPSEKDDTDMLAAIRVGLEKGCREFFLYGGLGGRLHTLDALVPDGFVQYDVIKPGDPDGFIDILGDVVIRPDEEMSSELAYACGGVRGLLATGERFVGSADDKADIISRFPGVLAADMESAAVAQVCARLGVPFACIRIISDEGDISEYYDFKYRAADKAVSALLNVLK